jgi:hypothetical protein
MKMFNIHGKEVSVDVRPSSYPIKESSRSILQQRVGEMLKETFQREVVLEEFTVPGSRMKLDFFIPKFGLAVEIQGKQHAGHVGFFHGDKNFSTKYAGQKSRDRQKHEWAELNNFTLIEINYGESEQRIREIIARAT